MVLQKVASFDQGDITETVNTLVKQGFVAPEHRDRVAGYLASDFRYAIHLLNKVAGLHEEPAPSMGAGIDKQAGNGAASRDPVEAYLGDDEDDWLGFIRGPQ